jgi:hypothetical protein
LGRFGCCATAERGVVGVAGVEAPFERSPPLRRGHLRFGGGGGGMFKSVLCSWLTCRSDELLQAVLVEKDRRGGRRVGASERSERERETSFIVFEYIHK